MAQLIHTFTTLVKDADGRVYLAEVWGSQRDDGLWDGWLQLIAAEDGAVLRTNRETTQTHVGALTYWATGLEAGVPRRRTSPRVACASNRPAVASTSLGGGLYQPVREDI